MLILADDLGYGELGSYGQEKIATPNLDRLALQGTRFTRHYAGSTVCAPTRDSLLTGRHGGRADIRGNIELPGREGQHPLPAEAVTVAELLGGIGYATGCFGKWGLGEWGSSGDPNRQGFGTFFGYICQRMAHSYYPPHLWRNGEKVPLDNNPPVPGYLPLPDDLDPRDPASYARNRGKDYSSDRINAAALEFIGENHDQPFFLYYAPLLPHVALHVPDDSLEAYLGRWEETPATRVSSPHYAPRAAYAAMISRLDLYVGRVLDRLAELGIEDNTLVLFTSDNGPVFTPQVDIAFFNSAGGLRGYKTTFYEGGIRVPLIARWPGRIPEGRTSNLVSSHPDLLPTLLDAVGRPELRPAAATGLSLWSELRGDSASQPRHGALYWEFAGRGGKQAVLLGDWKGVRNDILSKGNLRVELYNLALDPAETTDVAAQHPGIVEQIEALMASMRVPSPVTPIPAIDRLAP